MGFFSNKENAQHRYKYYFMFRDERINEIFQKERNLQMMNK